MTRLDGDALLKRLPQVRGRLEANAPLADLTWFRAGGSAEVLFAPADEADLAAFLKDTPADAPWRQMLLAEMQDMNAKPPALDQQTMADASNMSADDQQAMIRSMVDGLDQKLAANPDNLEGWLRLIRARTVLGDTDKARAAYEKALETFSGNEDALAQIAALAREMKVE